MTSKRATITDVAREAGVSIKTVSRALNDAPHVSEAVRSKVREVAEALNYHPNHAAQSLAARRSFLIGLVYERPSPSYAVDLQNGALSRLEGSRYRLVVLPFSNVARSPVELGRLLLRTGLDGVLLAPPACDQIDLLEMLERQRLPYARITPQVLPERGISITLDEIAAAASAASHIIGLGHRRIGIIMGDPSHEASRMRFEGYSRSFRAAGLEIDEHMIVTGDFTYDVGYQVARELLERAPRPTAILAQNDDMGVATIDAARALGLDVPIDLSVVGFDDSDISRTTSPRLSTVHQPVREMTWDAADRLIAALDGPAGAPVPANPRHEHQLLLRASTAAPRDA